MQRILTAMNILTSINIKDRHVHFNEGIHLMYFTLYQKAREANAQTIASGKYYCPECKRDHYKDGTFSKFLSQYHKALPILARIQNQNLFY